MSGERASAMSSEGAAIRRGVGVPGEWCEPERSGSLRSGSVRLQRVVREVPMMPSCDQTTIAVTIRSV